MPSEFELRALAARAEIDVPPFPVHAIRAAAPQKNGRARKIGFLAAITALSMAAAAVAAILGSAHLRFTPHGGLVLTSDAPPKVIQNPTQADVRTVAAAADFQVTLPSGLPHGAQLTKLQSAGKDVIVLQYDLPGTWRAANHVLYVFLSNPAVINGASAATSPKRQLSWPHSRPYRVELWRVHGEEAIVVAAAMTAGEWASMKAAMLAGGRR
jgi:hypothetical protein